eukprot:TRINITY_DN20229_c0_g1_i1.p2 TRINITY_DN20229_c0_g1~~TRINITY_DN20229_c0_g1_i1.p2  ORF type:complete len:182 (-),score=4.92 TRINITY_DN20229_c0_g1_i1:816-1361(-)
MYQESLERFRQTMVLLDECKIQKVITILIFACSVEIVVSVEESEAKNFNEESFNLSEFLATDYDYDKYKTEMKSMNLETYINYTPNTISQESAPIMNSNDNYPTPKIEGAVLNEIEFEIPGVSFVLDHCNEVRLSCIHLQMRTRFVWNNETRQCEPIFPWCEFQGFQSHQECHEYTSEKCH